MSCIQSMSRCRRAFYRRKSTVIGCLLVAMAITVIEMVLNTKHAHKRLLWTSSGLDKMKQDYTLQKGEFIGKTTSKQFAVHTKLSNQIDVPTKLGYQVAVQTDLSNQITGQTKLSNQIAVKTELSNQIAGQTKFTNKQQTTKHYGQTATGPSSLLPKDIMTECQPKFDPTEIKTDFKFYIYNLPTEFNFNIKKLMTKDRAFSYCYNLDHCGMGEELMQYPGTEELKSSIKGTPLSKLNHTKGKQPTHVRLSIRNTHQFALESIMHHKLLYSPYRTMDPDNADIFYIPAYTGLMCLSNHSGANIFIDHLFDYLNKNETKYFKSGKPHFSTLSKIQREQGSKHCSTLLHPDTKNITFIAIERESNPSWHRQFREGERSIIVAPYPSYIHYIGTRQDDTLLEYNQTSPDLTTQVRLRVSPLLDRNIFLFLASGTRRSNSFRAKLLDQFRNKTDKSYEDYFNRLELPLREQYVYNKNKSNVNYPQIMLKTIECSEKHRKTTIPWMMRSVFCLQPPGDSPTRKSFYDSILSGCIPVIFSERFKTVYPFESRLHYNNFTITIDEKLISRYDKSVVEILKEISSAKIEYLHKNLLSVAKWFQYSVPGWEPQQDDDAVTLILEGLKTLYKLGI